MRGTWLRRIKGLVLRACSPHLTLLKRIGRCCCGMATPPPKKFNSVQL